MTCTMTVGKSGIYTGNTGIRPPRCMGLRGRPAASAVNGEYCRRAIAAGDDQLCHHDYPFDIVCTSARVGIAYSGHMATGGELLLADLEIVLPPTYFVNARLVRCQAAGPAADFGRLSGRRG